MESTFIWGADSFTRGETTQAQELLLKWERHARFPWSVCPIRVLLARLQLAHGDLRMVEQWVPLSEPIPSSQASEKEQALLLVRLHLAQKKGETALKALAPWKEKAKEREFISVIVTCPTRDHRPPSQLEEGQGVVAFSSHIPSCGER